MNDPKAEQSTKQPQSPDELSQTGEETGIELTEKQLENASGGAADIFAKIGDIKGESRR